MQLIIRLKIVEVIQRVTNDKALTSLLDTIGGETM